MMTLVAAFISGLLLFNAIPHLVQGICGKSHMTPFAPRSSAWVNVIWAWINITAGTAAGCFSFLHCCQPGMSSWIACRPGLPAWIAFGLGGFVISLYLAIFWSNPDARLPWHPQK